jgi:cbb3-type cytochrome oxidase subunit 1
MAAMARYTLAFVWAALIYFAAGILLGVTMALLPGSIGTLLLVHVHLNLLGWVSMFIYGVAYHVLPRFSGQPLHSPRLADLHVVLANVGLVGMVVGFVVQGPGPIVGVFGALEAIGGLVFVYNVGRTIWPATFPRRAGLPLQPARPRAA